MQVKKTGWRRVVAATGYSWCGLVSGWKSEAAIRQEVVLLLAGVPLAFYLDVSRLETLALVLSLVLVLVVELLNSAVEAVVDRIGYEHHELSGKAKDLGSAAVFVSVMGALFTWAVILW